MMHCKQIFVAMVLTMLVAISPAQSCPLCQSEAGIAVWEGIFNRTFLTNFVAIAAPFIVFLGLGIWTGALSYHAKQGRER